MRPSAYALLRDEESRIAVVRSTRGWFLPGGGIEPGETAERAVERESQEECGLLIAADRRIGSATEIVHSPAGHAGVEKASVFIEAVVVGTSAATELNHALVWLSVRDAIARLSHKSHQWAVHVVSEIAGLKDCRTKGITSCTPEVYHQKEPVARAYNPLLACVCLQRRSAMLGI